MVKNITDRWALSDVVVTGYRDGGYYARDHLFESRVGFAILGQPQVHPAVMYSCILDAQISPVSCCGYGS